MDLWERGAQVGAAVMTYFAGETGRALLVGAHPTVIRGPENHIDREVTMTPTEKAVQAATALLAWVQTEAGWNVAAAAFGGLVRWLTTPARRARALPLALAMGVLCGAFLWPLPVAILRLASVDLLEYGAEGRATAWLLAGALGFTLVRVITEGLARWRMPKTGGFDGES